ncbi:hypothetical protein A2Z22_00730 [Candidatus Woesebacteria bacterium RBG_16_34_12]|uniref:Uncharacterized protein n=1 Tax=Candidatus Woesebacteria bacterium RBG_16_34_12 TaxID=1802480 RepID=A0A1F7X8Y8_9BACT|nr:MAG: hypothetical protein A2Z22_00730 [Candidatus Woesebacteria bacterium RBG_16_34_12]
MDLTDIITAIATVALVIVTGFLVWATKQLVNITKNQDKPWLHFYFRLGDFKTIDRLYVKNIGKGAALEVEFTLKHGLIAYTQKLDALAPTQEFALPGDFDSSEIPPDNSKIYEIDKIMYKDINKNAINQPKIEPKIMNFATYTDYISRPKI